MPPTRTLRIAIDVANLDEVRTALSAATSLALAVKSIEDLVPGKANPVILERASLDRAIGAANGYIDAVGELRETEDEDAPAE